MSKVQEQKLDEASTPREDALAYSEIFDDLLEGLDAARAHFQGQVSLPTTTVVDSKDSHSKQTGRKNKIASRLNGSHTTASPI